MRAVFVRFWTEFRIVILLALVVGLLSFSAAYSLNNGLGAVREAEQLRDFGIVANVTDVRIHVSRSPDTSATSSGSGGAGAGAPLNANGGYSVDEVQVGFTDPQGQQRSETLASDLVQGTTPRKVGWTTHFEGHDNYVGKAVLYLPNDPLQAMMRDQMQLTLDHGYEPAKIYGGVALSVLALLGWAAFARVSILKLRPRMDARQRRLGIT